MKRLGKLWPKVIAWENLLLALAKASKGKRRRPDVAEFALQREVNLLTLQQELIEEAYQPGGYRLFTIYERKPRVIAAAPFRDRVVHHAVMNIIEPPLDRRFIADSYACRAGKGVHAAVNRYQQFAQRNEWVLKLDISRYFPSIDHLLLKQALQRRIKDKLVMNLLETIIDSSPASSQPPAFFPGDDLLTAMERPRGIPIGNLTSQFFANLYLDDLDHWLLETRRLPGYMRYVDDLFLFSSDKVQLRETEAALQEYLLRLSLTLHPTKIQLRRTSERVDVLGYTVSRTRRWLRNDNGCRAIRRFRGFAERYARGEIDFFHDILPRLQSWNGHAIHGETEKLREKIFNEIYFQRA